jgi:multidrug resistance protein, MATE family
LSLLDSTYKSIWKIAFPIIIGSFAQSIISVTDTAFMGRIGATEQAAIGLVSIYYLILFMIGFSYTKGTQIFVARRTGERRYEEVGKIVDNSFLVMFIFSLIIFVFLRFFSDFTLQYAIQDESVRAASAEFLQVRSYGVVFGYAGALLLSFYMGIGKPSVILVSILTMSGLNVLLNYVLIFGKWGFPQMGISGAAWASNIAEIVATSIFIFHSIWARYHEKFKLFQLNISKKIITDITNLSLPIVMQTGIGLMAWMIFFTYVEKMGKIDLAVSSVVKSLYTLFGIPAWAFASAANTIVSNLMGQQKQKDVSTAIKKIVTFSSGLIFLLALPLAIFPYEFMRFYTVDAVVIEAGKSIIYVCIIALLVYSVSTILYNGIVSTGSSKVSLCIEVAAVIAYLIYTHTIYSLDSRTLSLMWTSEIFYWFIIALFSFIYLKTGRWKRKVI